MLRRLRRPAPSWASRRPAVPASRGYGARNIAMGDAGVVHSGTPAPAVSTRSHSQGDHALTAEDERQRQRRGAASGSYVHGTIALRSLATQRVREQVDASLRDRLERSGQRVLDLRIPEHARGSLGESWVVRVHVAGDSPLDLRCLVRRRWRACGPLVVAYCPNESC